jgi:hypothetical protein
MPIAKGKGKATASTSTPTVTVTAPGPPMDLWVYLRNNECHAVLPILDMLFCDMEDNHSEVVCLLEDASTPLVHPSTFFLFLFIHLFCS